MAFIWWNLYMPFVNEKHPLRTIDYQRNAELKTIQMEHISSGAWKQEFNWSGSTIDLVVMYRQVIDAPKPKGIKNFLDCFITSIKVPKEPSSKKEEALSLLFEALKVCGLLHTGSEHTTIREINYGPFVKISEVRGVYAYRGD